jgi:adhesin transport system outer membrane protein
MNSKLKTYCMIVGLGFIYLVTMAGYSFADSIRQAAGDAVAYHPDVKALLANRRAIGEELVAAEGLARPGVRVEGRYGAYHGDSTSTQGYGEASVKLRQPLYLGGKIQSETTRQTFRVDSATSRLADTVETVALQAVQAYLEMVRAKRVLSRAVANSNVVDRIYNRVSDRVNGGGGNSADLEQVRARRYAAKTAVTNARIQTRDALALFKTAVGRDPGKLRQDDLPKRSLSRSLDDVLNRARDMSPKLLAIKFDADAAEAAIGTARSELLPQVALELSANHADRIRSVSQERQSLKAMVVVSMSLYNGGINHARLREARYRADEAKHLIGSAQVSVERELRLSWNKYHGSGSLVQNLLNQSRANRRLVDLRLQQYDSGLATLISILDAQNEAFVAGVQATNEFNAGRFAFFKLLAATGTLAETLGVVRSLDQ